MRARLCNTFKNASTTVWNLLSDSQYYGLYQTSTTNRICGLGIGEETITDDLLLFISKNQPRDFKTVKSCPSSYEPIVGSDWEWWFLSTSGCVGLRIQAKRIHNHNGNYTYDCLDSPINQVDTLINNAKCLRILPLYVFYNYWDITFPYTTYLNTSIKFNKCTKISFGKNLGMVFAPAFKIRNLIKNNPPKRNLKDVLPLCWPIYSLTCCVFSDLSESVSTFLNKYVCQDQFKVKILEKLPGEIFKRLRGETEKNVPMYTAFILDLEHPSNEWDDLNKLLGLKNDL